MGKQYLNGVLYGSPAVVADEVVDYSTSLYNGSTTSWESIISYTAIQKCIVYLRYTGNNGTNMYPILNDGNSLFNLGILKTAGYYTCSIILQPGDTIASRYQANEDRYGTPYFHMKIFPIKANASANYSTSEHIVGTWIDGKPLYEKTIDCGALPAGSAQSATTKDVAHNISDLGFVVSISGSAKRANGFNRIPLPFVSIETNTEDAQVRVMISDTYVRLSSSYNRSEFTESYVTIRYTKTTD